MLGDGPTAREEAEALIVLHEVLERAYDGWPAYLAGALKIVALSISKPCRSIDQAAEWLVAILADPPSKTSILIAREMVQEAQHTHPVLLDFVGKGLKGKAKPREAATCRRACDPTPCLAWLCRPARLQQSCEI